jgi:PTH1 family peptidyl-tRNA hydrolase
MLLDRIAERSGQVVQRLSGRSLICAAELAGREVLLAKPQTYMNWSGLAVQELVLRGGFAPSDCLIVLDEIALPLGKIRLRPSGSAGGHRGMQSTLRLLGSEDWPRLRIGVSGADSVDNLSDYVLSTFAEEELELLQETLERSVSAVEVLLEQGMRKAMTLYN